MRDKPTKLHEIIPVAYAEELPLPARRRFQALNKDAWSAEDWRDLLLLQRVVAHNVAVRHGLFAEGAT